MREGHAKDVIRLRHKLRGDGLTPQRGYVNFELATGENRISAWRLTVHSPNAAGCYLDVIYAFTGQKVAKETLRHWTTANVSCTDKQDFYGLFQETTESNIQETLVNNVSRKSYLSGEPHLNLRYSISNV